MQVKDLQLKKAFRFVLMALLISMANLNSYAERVDPATAQRVAATFLNNNGVRSNQLTNISERAGFPNLYIFNSEQGFVILAADDCVKPILGYSLTGRFMAENMPANLRWWLQGYNDEIQYIIDNQLCAPTEIAQEWEELTRGRFDVAIRTAVVEPLITTKWDQDYPFNYYCPEILGGPGGHCYAGCVATAMAQIVRYHQHPEVGVGSHSYTWNGQTLSAIFGATIYSYSDMPDTINSVNYDIAGLIYDCGISVDMDYDYDVSSADAVDAVDALQNYFDYGICEFKFKSEYQEEWMDMVKTELNHDRPLLYYGKGDESIGHAFVCDGYDSYGFHFNWGWGGKCDGYYPLELLQPWYLGPNNNLVPQGNYTNIQGAIFGIQPSEHSCDAPNMLSGSINGRTVTFTWEAVPNVDSYSVYCNGTMIEPAFTGTTYTSNNLEIGLYHFYVRSNCSDGSKSASSYIAQFEIEYQGDVAATIGDLRYSLNELTLTAEVIGHKDGLSASGSLNIPSSVTYTNQYGQTHTYTITSIGNSAFYYCNNLTGTLIIPNSVTTIGDSAFNGCSGFTGSLTIPNSVTSIEWAAFGGCTGLTSVTIPNSVISLSGFGGCTGLTSITIPNSVTSIGNYAFFGCSSLAMVTIPNSVTSIGDYTFSGCGSLASVSIPNSITSIGNYAFYDCSDLTTVYWNAVNVTNYPFSSAFNNSTNFSVVFGDMVQTIPAKAFADCSGLNTVTIGNSVTSIGERAFYDCSGLTTVYWNAVNASYLNYGYAFDDCTNLATVVFGNMVQAIPNRAFYGCSGLISVTIPNSVTSIGSQAFQGCSSLSSITIPNSVTSIEAGTFQGCSNLTTLTIHNTMTSIGPGAFSGCTGLTTVYWNAVNASYSWSSCPFSGCTNLATVVFGDMVQTIPDNAFYGCDGLTTLIIGNSVTTIGYDAFSRSLTTLFWNTVNVTSYSFENYTHLSTVVFGDMVQTIPNRFLYNCRGLTGDLVIPNSVTTIGKDAFYNCSFSGTLTIGNSVTSIGPSAFENCSGFTGDLIIPNSVITIGDVSSYGGSFQNCSGFTGNLVIGNSVTTIGNDAFSGCSGLTGNLVIGNSVTTIGEGAFGGCSGFTGNLVIGNSVTSIGQRAFANCSGFTGDLIIPDSVVTIGDASLWAGTFQNCSGFTGNLVIGNSVTTIGRYAFCNCSGLTDLTIGNSVTSIEDYAFYNCSDLTTVNWNAVNVTIASYPFYYCPNLTTVVFGNQVQTIPAYAFDGCSGLTGSLTIPSSVTSIGTYAFYNCSGLEALYYTGDFEQWCNIEFVGSSSNPLYYAHNLYVDDELVTSLVIPESITEIKNNTFSGCNLTSLTIPNSVTSIGSSAFYGCSGLTSLTIPNSVTSIGDYAFYYCTGINAIRMQCAPPAIYNNTFTRVNKAIPVFVPCGTQEDYATADYWSEFETISESPYNLIVTQNDPLGGEVSVVHYADCDDNHCAILATNNIGYNFVGWFVNDYFSTDLPYCDFSLIDNVTFEARFERRPNHFITIVTSTSNTWSDPNTWDTGEVPSSTSTVAVYKDIIVDVDAEVSKLGVYEDNSITISPDVTLTVTDTLGSDNVASIVIENGGQLIHSSDEAMATVKKSVEPYTTDADGWNLISFPLTDNGTVASIGNMLSNQYDLYAYDEATHYWINQKDENNSFMTLDAGKGYLYANGGAETIYSFEDSNMDGWTIIDADGDGYNWGFATTPAHYGSGCIKSASYINGIGVLTPDNYIVSPQVSFTSSSKITFWACAQDANYAADHFGVAVSTTGNTNPADFTTIEEWTMTAKSTRTLGNWYQYTLNLGQFAGQTGYVALRHFNCQDMFYIIVDEVRFDGFVYEGPQNIILSFAGELENGAATINLPLSYTETAGNLKGFNLVGNPFVHNVTSFARTNVAEECYRMNDAKDNLIVSEVSETQPLKPAEGFFVKATAEGASITFNPGRSRGETEKKGFVNLELNKDGKLIDRLIVKREGEPLEKLSLKENGTRIFTTNGNQEMAVAVAESNEQPVNFKAAKNGTYTINVNVNNLEFDYLHLIDNLTGADVDLLVEPTYTFGAKTTDYDSRFKLVFSASGDENDEDAPFAFINNGNIIIVGAEDGAILQIMDVLGHVIHSGDAMNRVSTNGMSPGVYVLRLINGDDVRVQKIVIR